MDTNTTKYILKDNLNTYISIHNTEDEVFDKLQQFSKKFKDGFSTFGARLDAFGDSQETLEDNAVFTIPRELKKQYNNQEYITFYFFKFDLKTNKRISLY